MRKQLLKGKTQKYVLVSSSSALLLSIFLPVIASAKSTEASAEEKANYSYILEESSTDYLSQLSPQEQQELADIINQTIVKDENGIYKFDADKARNIDLSEEEITKANYFFTNVLTQKDIRLMVGQPVMSTYGKGSITAKALIKVLKKYSSKVDAAIDKGIDLLPFVKKDTKKAWKKVLTTVALIKVLDNFIGVTDTAENLVVRGIKTLIPGIPDWAATGIAKTLMMILPI
ncbi:hypothetical protein [Rummeliibacillus suwonensis]|uniref:hypothetical protein n=1 Tax=Rummeliibacillus suwonensis TaxID=1306154 RepID=UPI001AAFFD66|nr:hypothetical protein [Rummeliibacillus suwonensis]MBO2535298.1 hypothetical protein [Rummeliibacillus suwonensis]